MNASKPDDNQTASQARGLLTNIIPPLLSFSSFSTEAREATERVIADMHNHGCGFLMVRLDGIAHVPLEDVVIGDASDGE